jgi:16S rRNA processing protein RimM
LPSRPRARTVPPPERSSREDKAGQPPSAAGRSRRQIFTPRPLIQTPGPDPDTPVEHVRLAVGRVVGAHGLAGELKVVPLTDDTDQFDRFRFVYLGDEAIPRRVRGVRFHGGQVLLRLAGIGTRDGAEAHRGEMIRVRGAELRPLDEGEYFLYQLIGLEARDQAGERLGTVVDLIETGTADVVVIQPDGDAPQVLLPNIPTAVLEIRPRERVMVVRPLDYIE